MEQKRERKKRSLKRWQGRMDAKPKEGESKKTEADKGEKDTKGEG